MLVNDGIAVRTARVASNTYFYTLPKKDFLRLCEQYSQFSDYFTNTFGKRMIDRSYAAIIRKKAVSDAEASQLFNLKVAEVYQDNVLWCRGSDSIQQASIRMNQKGCSSIFVKSSTDEYIGLVTDQDIRSKVVATGHDIQGPVTDIMSSPLHCVPMNAMVSDAMMEMMENNIKHLAVTSADTDVVGILTNSDILSAQESSPFFLIRDIGAASTINELAEKRSRLPKVIKSMINNGAKSIVITKLITKVSDVILNKLLDFALDQHGPAPADFAFFILGSEGRMEQTLKTDQDNAIIFADVDSEDRDNAQQYFLSLGKTVCGWLDRVGYAYCNGEIMAQNPKWCLPLSEWKSNFFSWIRKSTKEDLLNATIFFDFRGAYGNLELVDELRLFLFQNLVGWTRFFKDLTETALEFRPPIGFLKKIVVETKGKHRNKFSIKNAMTPIVDFARIHALNNNIADTNTQDRLYRLHLDKVITKELYKEVNQAYDYLMQQRLICQIDSIEAGEAPDNYIDPRNLSQMEQTLFRTIFKRIEGLQNKLKMSFIGGI
jgi:CBS domain-containing protein